MNLGAIVELVPITLRARAQSAVVSYLWGLWVAEAAVLGAGITDGKCLTPGDTLAYMTAHWWGGFLAATVPAAYRANQANKAATSVVNTATYTSIPKAFPAPQPPPKD